MKMLRKLPVARKFMLSFGAVCASCGLLGAVALVGMAKINESTTKLADVALPSAHDLAQMQSAMQVLRRGDMGILACDTSECTKYYLDRRKKIADAFVSATNAFLAEPIDAEERALAE